MSDWEIYHRNPDKRSKPLDLVLSTSTLEQVSKSTANPTSSDRTKAARFAASCATNAAECAEFLAMLGLSPQEGAGLT